LHDRLFVALQQILPKRALTVLAGRFARAQLGALTHFAIRRFVAHYRVDMAEAAQPDIARYASFNDFFTRALRADARPLAQADWICPVDGAISQFGAIEAGQISRPRDILTAPRPCSAAMLRLQRSSRRATLPRFT